MRFRSSVIAFMALTLVSASSQDLHISRFDLDGRQEGFHIKFDSGRVFGWRNTADSPGVALGRMVTQNGESIGLYPLRNLPGAFFANAWDIAATPDGGAVIAAIVGYGPEMKDPTDKNRPPLKNMLLKFASNGKFISAIETGAKTHTERVVTDNKGNIYSLQDSGIDGAYPMMVEYSSSGSLVKGFMSSDSQRFFSPSSNQIVEGGDAIGPESRIWIREDRLSVWLSEIKVFLEFSLSGQLLKKVPIGELLNESARDAGFDHLDVAGMGVTSGGDLVMQCRFWPRANSSNGVQIVMSRVIVKSGQVQRLGSMLNGFLEGELLDLDEKNSLVFLMTNGDGSAIVRHKEIPPTFGSFAKK